MLSSDDVTIAYRHFGGDGPPLLLAHATGFCAEVWRPMAAVLAPWFSCWGLDFRGHGRSTVPSSGSFRWSGTADDVLAVIDDIEASDDRGGPWFGVGHSMGGASLLLAEERRPTTFGAMWLFEPIVAPPGLIDGGAEGDNPLADAAERRRPVFASRQAALDNYGSKPPMQAFARAALDGYLDGGLLEQPDGTVRLACEPANEAKVFRMGGQHDAFEHLHEIRCPATVARGVAMGFGPADFAPAVADRLPMGRLEEHPTLDHFGPMVDPVTLANAILSVARPTITP